MNKEITPDNITWKYYRSEGRGVNQDDNKVRITIDIDRNKLNAVLSLFNYSAFNTPEEQPEKSCELCKGKEYRYIRIPCPDGKLSCHIAHYKAIPCECKKQSTPEPPKEWKKSLFPQMNDLSDIEIIETVNHNAEGIQLALKEIKELEKHINKHIKCTDKELARLENKIDKQNISIAKNAGLIAALYSEKEHNENEYTERIKELQSRIDNSFMQDAEYIAKMLIDIAQLNLDIAKD